MAAAGPSTRASSAAAAAALSRRGRRGRCDEMAAAKTGTPGPASGPALLVLPPPLLQPPLPPRPEESGCAGCLETSGEAAALPCGHSLCRGCAQRAADAAGPGCPRCRARGPGWACRRARDDEQADAEVLGERARRGPPERCRPRRDGGAAVAGPRPEQEPRAAPAEPEFIFRAPIKLSKPGGLREEYESLRRLKEEKLQEEKTSEDPIHKLLPEDTEIGKKKMDEQKKRDEPSVLKTNLERCPARLSDSENEEPSRGKMIQTHRSAFVSKNSSYSLAFLAGNLNSKMERSQSCSDTGQDRAKSRLRAAPTSKAKVTTITPASNPIIGVLLSTQNNRCLSAPDLTVEKRLPFSSLASLTSLHKPERSISPESNDSISEELNHFKPIVCSPCTPPKRLPDGRVLSPLIIKSTPRNLNRSLQKQTSYEASPRILKKWEQIFQERQIKKTLSKATLTSLAPDTGEDLLVSEVTHSSKERSLLALNTRLSSGQVLSEYTGPTPTDLDHLPSVSQTPAERGSDNKRSTESLLETCCSSELKVGASGTSLEREPFEGAGSSPDAKMDKNCVTTTVKVSAVNSVLPKNSVLGGVLKAKKQLKAGKHFELPNGALTDGLGEEPLPSLRRGRKRRCKTKHLEQNGSFKKLRQSGGEVGLAPADPVLREMEQKLQQEEEDRQLALQLQRMFDNERRTVSRRKGSVDQYLLRSSNVAGAK
ncbi:E3 ubiquitin-protein ligase RNF169 [Sus scrofa]|uniref:E3 ubiquitin-protein ligase RNF169 n=2 Tax=Sus scrofa TaxID=9823 RepID=F1SUP8_PIG|nr:E3 ubiquitin-protein ligase RNF169 [Sus scrofa]XP_020918164.1 E3 ubiquitin-protein ligase RNF169 [Sus scrofa]XP_020918165.1 E3 ubiquitin-protein ligase RNF169 [Sus scrofa]XP_020918166.1 E3 ubiquitin-protein ligase RNF169 [Sus scrofa]XP_020918167.1 E3 ubiquitin-protein ligase RNF169 [Sus scrofa]XP_020918168.1 E3 ubiquitin-protein ligase RNF169 [Sus scrofa]